MMTGVKVQFSSIPSGLYSRRALSEGTGRLVSASKGEYISLGTAPWTTIPWCPYPSINRRNWPPRSSLPVQRTVSLPLSIAWQTYYCMHTTFVSPGAV